MLISAAACTLTVGTACAHNGGMVISGCGLRRRNLWSLLDCVSQCLRLLLESHGTQLVDLVVPSPGPLLARRLSVAVTRLGRIVCRFFSLSVFFLLLSSWCLRSRGYKFILILLFFIAFFFFTLADNFLQE